MKPVIFSLIVSFLLSSTCMAMLPEASQNLIPKTSSSQVKTLSKLAKKSGAFGDYFKLRLAEQKLKSKDINKAFRLASVVSEPLFCFWKDVLLAEYYLITNNKQKALALLRNLPKQPDYSLAFGEGIYENLYKRALIISYLANKSLGKSTKEEAVLIQTLFPADQSLNSILQKEDQNITLSSKEKITKLNNLYQKRKLKQIPGLIDSKSIKTSPVNLSTKCQALYQLGSAERISKDHKDNSINTFLTMLNLPCSDDYLPLAYYRLGATEPSKKSSQKDQRKKYLIKLYKQYPAHRLADDALYKLYYLEVANKNNDNASSYYKELMKRETGDMKAELAFSLAFSQFKKSKHTKAANILSKALKTNPTNDESYPKILYWYARSLEKTANKQAKNKSKKIYHQLITTFPYSFYAMMANQRVKNTITLPRLPQINISNIETTPELIEIFDLINVFNKKGFHKAARSTLDLVLHKKPDLLTTNKDFIVKNLIESQNYRTALEIASNHFNSGVYAPIQGSDTPLFSAFFPRPFKKTIKTIYDKTDLPLGAIEGIMREESLFQRSAISHAGARGLMQVMPSTATYIKKGLIKNGIDVSWLSHDLNDTKTSLYLGATYLDQMRSKYDNQLPLAIMAYNAGPGNVNKWLKKFGNLELDEFIETVPFTETKGYVKRVLRSMHVYGDLYKNAYFTKGADIDFKIKR